MKIDYNLLGRRIARLRKERRLTQDKLSEKAEISNNYLSNIENGRSIPSLETLCLLYTSSPSTRRDSPRSTKARGRRSRSIPTPPKTPKEKETAIAVRKEIPTGKNGLFISITYLGYFSNTGRGASTIKSLRSMASPSARTAALPTILPPALCTSCSNAAMDSPVLTTSSTISTRLPSIEAISSLSM